MNMPARFRGANLSLFLWLALFSINARADIDNAGLLDNVLNRYSTAASTWAATITTHATWLFWTLALISMVWTFGMMALRRADIGEFFAEFVRFTIFTGFFWWLLTNGPNFATSIMNSMRTIAANAAGTGSVLSPSGIVDIGFDIFSKMIDQSSVLSPLNSAVGITISAIVLIILALIGVNMLLLLVSGWILAYAGVFFLGFGGSRWTSDMAIHYFKTVLSIAAQLFTMVLLVGIGKSFIDLYYSNMSAGMSLKELGVMLIVAVVLLALVNKIPATVGQLAMGGGTSSLGNGFGAGAVVGAAAIGAAAAATTGAALVAGLANIGGGAQALMAAYSKANAAASAGGSSGDLMAAAGGGTSGPGGNGNGGGSSFAAAMGDDSSGSSFGVGNHGGGGPGMGSATERGAASRKSGDARGSTKVAAQGSGSQSGSASAGSDTMMSRPQGGISLGEGSGGSVPMAGSESDTGSGDAQNSSLAEGSSSKSDNDDNGSQSSGAGVSPDARATGPQGGGAPGQVQSINPLAAAGAAVAKVGKVTVGTASNLVQGSWDVTKAKGNEFIEAVMDRVSDTVGGKIATAIKARDAASRPGAGRPAPFDKDSLSAGTNEAPDAASEVAAFRDRDPKAP